jgi:hypothetical protein
MINGEKTKTTHYSTELNAVIEARVYIHFQSFPPPKFIFSLLGIGGGRRISRTTQHHPTQP